MDLSRFTLTRRHTLSLGTLAAGSLVFAPRLALPASADDGPVSSPEPVVEPPPAADSALALINAYRFAAGAGPAQLHPALQQAAAGHVGYYDANRGDPALNGMGLHQQQAGKPGFTGTTMGERAKAAGYGSGSVTENAGFGSIESSIAWGISTVNHRLPLIHPSALDFGYAVSGSGFTIIDAGLRREKLAVPLPSVFPGDGATEVPLSWDGGETPNPAPGVPRPLGYPVTIAFGITQRVEWQSFALFGPGGEPLPISTPLTDWMRAAAIIPHRPFQRGQIYTARVEAVVDGKPVAKEWGFITRA